jgi:shikimate kinase
VNVYLIGYRGVGKSTVAPLAAALLERPWIDLDAEIERAQGRPIATLFAERGEQWFRDREAEALTIAASLNGLLAATGGGVVIREGNRAILRLGVCIWLRASTSTILGRLQASSHRPKLTELRLEEETSSLLREREPHYRALASHVVDVDGMTPSQIAAEIGSKVIAAE